METRIASEFDDLTNELVEMSKVSFDHCLEGFVVF